MTVNTERTRLGILVGGGPAPGINGVISACAIEGANSGLDVIGIYDGFEHLINGDTSMVRPLAISDVSRIHFQGGSMLRISRADPTRTPEDLQRTIQTIMKLGLTYLVAIGGDGTAFLATELANAAMGAFRVAHVPKTIDNDLPLPGGMPTFGFETARHVGTELVLNLMEDSLTTNRWYFVTVMGREAGHLALGIGKAAGATLTIIPEEFPGEHVRLEDICGVLEGAILKRRVMGRKNGLAIIAEGMGEKLDLQELAALSGVSVEHEANGRIRLGEIPLATVLKRRVQQRFADRGDRTTITDVTLGYDLRGAPPIPFDIDYTRTLGYGAVRFLLTEPSDARLVPGGMVYLERGHLNAMPFDELRDSATGRTRVRLVDVESQHYEVARKYMIRLERRDLEDPEMLSKLAQAADTTSEEMGARFGHLVGLEAGRIARVRQALGLLARPAGSPS
jgi:6-phosphofructokinase 1